MQKEEKSRQKVEVASVKRSFSKQSGAKLGRQALNPMSSWQAKAGQKQSINNRRSTRGRSKWLSLINSSLCSKDFLASWRSCRTLFGGEVRQECYMISVCSLTMAHV